MCCCVQNYLSQQRDKTSQLLLLTLSQPSDRLSELRNKDLSIFRLTERLKMSFKLVMGIQHKPTRYILRQKTIELTI